MTTSFLHPALALVCWTLIMWAWMYATRIPAMQKAGIDPQSFKHPNAEEKTRMPSRTRAIADNYNHLHEQPTIFYALMFYTYLTGLNNYLGLAISLAWGYVALRIMHSLIQATVNVVVVRFLVFVLTSLCLIGLALINVAATI